MEDFDAFASRFENELGDECWIDIRRASRKFYPGNHIEAADRMVRSMGFKPLGDKWVDLDQYYIKRHGPKLGDSSQMLAEMLQYDMVHVSIPWVEPIKAHALAAEFYSYFQSGNPARLGNYMFGGCNPVTNSTFEAVYIAVDDEHVGVVAFQNED